MASPSPSPSDLDPADVPPPRFVPLRFTHRTLDESRARAHAFFEEMNRRRTTRHFAADDVPRELIECAIRTAGTAPSGAHQQPWTFVAVSDPALKRQIRDAAEAEEREFYNGKAPREWLEALAPLGTDEHKPHLTDAPWLVVLFRQAYGLDATGHKRTFYYTEESAALIYPIFQNRESVEMSWQPDGLVDATREVYIGNVNINEFSPSNTVGSVMTSPFSATAADEDGITATDFT